MKIFRHSKRLFGTIEAMKNVLPIASSMLLLFVSLILMFGVTGVVLFGHMCVQGDENLPGARANRCLLIDPKNRLNRYAAFGNVLQSTLVRVCKKQNVLLMCCKSVANTVNGCVGALPRGHRGRLVQFDATGRSRQGPVPPSPWCIGGGGATAKDPRALSHAGRPGGRHPAPARFAEGPRSLGGLSGWRRAGVPAREEAGGLFVGWTGGVSSPVYHDLWQPLCVHLFLNLLVYQQLCAHQPLTRSSHEAAPADEPRHPHSLLHQ